MWMLPASLLACCCSCTSADPVDVHHMTNYWDGSRAVIDGDARTEIRASENRSQIRRLLEESGRQADAEKLLARNPVRESFVCRRDESGNTCWYFAREDILERAAGAVRRIPDSARRRQLAQELLTLWQSGSEEDAMIFYEQALSAGEPACSLHYETAAETKGRLTPVCAIREGYVQSDMQSGKTEFVRHGLQLEFSENGAVAREYRCRNGEVLEPVLVFGR